MTFTFPTDSAVPVDADRQRPRLYGFTDGAWKDFGTARSFSFDVAIDRDAYRVLSGLPPLCCARFPIGRCDEYATSVVHSRDGETLHYCGPHGREITTLTGNVHPTASFLRTLRVQDPFMAPLAAVARKGRFPGLVEHLVADMGPGLIDFGVVRNDDFRRNEFTVFAEQHVPGPVAFHDPTPFIASPPRRRIRRAWRRLRR